MDFSIRTIILLIILLIAISVFAVLIWYPLGYVLNEGFFEGMFGGYGRIMADYLLIAYIVIICVGTWILLLLYILYILIDPIFVVNIPIFGPIIAKILLSITPFRELRETGVVKFFNDIFKLATTTESLGKKVAGIFSSSILFLLQSTKQTAPEFIKKPDDNTSNSNQDLKEPYESNKKTTTATDDELEKIESCARKQYIINKHADCINKNVKKLPSTMGGFERIKTQSQNTSAKLKCDMEKIRYIQCIVQQEQDEKNGNPIQSVSQCLENLRLSRSK